MAVTSNVTGDNQENNKIIIDYIRLQVLFPNGSDYKIINYLLKNEEYFEDTSAKVMADQTNLTTRTIQRRTKTLEKGEWIYRCEHTLKWIRSRKLDAAKDPKKKNKFKGANAIWWKVKKDLLRYDKPTLVKTTINLRQGTTINLRQEVNKTDQLPCREVQPIEINLRQEKDSDNSDMSCPTPINLRQKVVTDYNTNLKQRPINEEVDNTTPLCLDDDIGIFPDTDTSWRDTIAETSQVIPTSPKAVDPKPRQPRKPKVRYKPNTGFETVQRIEDNRELYTKLQYLYYSEKPKWVGRNGMHTELAYLIEHTWHNKHGMSYVEMNRIADVFRIFYKKDGPVYSGRLKSLHGKIGKSWLDTLRMFEQHMVEELKTGRKPEIEATVDHVEGCGCGCQGWT